jgi:transposase
MRKAINGLSILVEQAMDLNPFSGDLFVFCNRQRTIIKILYTTYPSKHNFRL